MTQLLCSTCRALGHPVQRSRASIQGGGNRALSEWPTIRMERTLSRSPFRARSQRIKGGAFSLMSRKCRCRCCGT